MHRIVYSSVYVVHELISFERSTAHFCMYTHCFRVAQTYALTSITEGPDDNRQQRESAQPAVPDPRSSSNAEGEDSSESVKEGTGQSEIKKKVKRNLAKRNKTKVKRNDSKNRTKKETRDLMKPGNLWGV